ncbi:rhodanese-like domain-containing protein [Saccharococcus thermophilus]|uniref:Rhodanese-related sulfurtransferase n=1 Tax=Saccharococcus thermophilus TaxID=29396 RepID=A0A846MJJ8_9BACL|nr:rhodanese-like domain-containing protein [Saccharococcus thermophilus]NIK15806.1 rhodanese-related sulfurtransferase [Saccharococcus thermophilus]
MNEIKEITAAEVKEKLERGEKLNIVDVREDEEVALGMIPGAKHIKMGEIPSRLDEFNKEEEYIFVCRSGRRSENVCYYLQELGYRVRNMVGGMLEWEGDTVPKK